MTIRPDQVKHAHRNIEGWRELASDAVQADESTGRRILLVWDFATVPYTIGELLYLQVRGLILKWLHQTQRVDVAFICDPESPARKDQGLSSYNYHPHFTSLVSVPLVSPNLGNFLLFDSHSEFEKYLRCKAHSYVEIWPTAEDYRSRKPAYTDSLKIIESFFAEHGWVPHLSCRPVMQDWAESFFLRTVLPDIPVTVQLRNNAAMKHGLAGIPGLNPGFSVFNATRGGELNLFPRVDFETLFPQTTSVGPVQKRDSGSSVLAMELGTAAVKLLNSGELAPALTLLDRAVAENVGHATRVEGLDYVRAICLFRMGRYAQASTAARADWVHNPSNRKQSEALLQTLHENVASAS